MPVMSAAVAARRVAAHGRARAGSWLAIARLVPLAGWPVAVAVIVVNLAPGVLPLGFVVGSSVMLDRVPATPGRWRACCSSAACCCKRRSR
jgi:hypothetical protein